MRMLQLSGPFAAVRILPRFPVFENLIFASRSTASTGGSADSVSVCLGRASTVSESYTASGRAPDRPPTRAALPGWTGT